MFRAHTDAVIAALEAAGLVVGDAEAPTDVDPREDPYVVVYPIAGRESFGTSRSGSLEEPFEDAELVYQVTCAGGSRKEVEWLADKVEVLLDGVTVAGRRIHVVPEMNPGVTRTSNETPPIFEATPRYRLMSTPS